MICFDTKGRILDQESKNNVLRDLTLYSPGTECFNLQILENMPKPPGKCFLAGRPNLRRQAQNL